MNIVIQTIEVLALISGIIYLILEIRQSNAMWFIGIATGLACAFSFGIRQLYASMGLNIYYVIISVWGLIQWKKDAKVLQTTRSVNDKVPVSIHLNRINIKTVIISSVLFIAGSVLAVYILDLLDDAQSYMDAIVTVMSIIGTVWLAKSYLHQWFIWIIADILSSILCFISGMYWMSFLYLLYSAAAVYGYIYWKNNGKYIEVCKSK